MTEETLAPLYLNSAAEIDSKNPFEADLYGRHILAKRLTGFLSRLPHGAVIAIDSAWGEGKTWFGRRWKAQLENEGYRTGYIDCFARDYLDDPFAMIAGEIIALSKKSKSGAGDKILELGKKIGAALLPVTAKVAVNFLGHWALGKTGLGDDLMKNAEALNKATAEGLEKLVAAKLEEYQKDNETIEAFKTELTKLAAEDDKPLIIFLDELDRCRPDFAVRTIERMKHFFDAPKVVFVLLWNRQQMVAAIEGIYGPNIDADGYLQKFVQLSLRFPKRSSLELNGIDDNRKHCIELLDQYGFSKGSDRQGFEFIFSILAAHFGMSFRDVERAVALYSLAQPIQFSSVFVAWPIALKIARPKLFARLLVGAQGAHLDAYKEISQIVVRGDQHSYEREYLDFFNLLHKAGVNEFSEIPPGLSSHLANRRWNGDVKGFFDWAFQRIDLTVTL